MHLKLDEFSSDKIYHLLTQTVIPRPIAWVLSTNPKGDYNLAPFSFFNAVSSNPPLLMFSVGKKPDTGEHKDSFYNIDQYHEMVIHLPSVENLNEVNQSSYPFDRDTSEISELNIKLTEFGDDSTKLPRVANCPVAFSCEKYQINHIGNTPQAIILAKVKSIYVDDKAVSLDQKNRVSISSKAINPLLRLGANSYSALGDLLSAKRPK